MGTLDVRHRPRGDARSGPGSAVTDHLACYKIKDSAAKVAYTANVSGLAVQAGCTIKVPAVLTCAPASKTNVTPAGHTDWRLPNLKELESIVNLESVAGVNPAISAAFNKNCTSPCSVPTCSCTQPSGYYSSDFFTNNPVNVFAVNFFDGTVFYTNKATFGYVRAVRGGS